MGFNRESLYIKGYWEESSREKKGGRNKGRKEEKEGSREGSQEEGREWGGEERGERQEREKIENRNRPCKRSPSRSSE